MFSSDPIQALGPRTPALQVCPYAYPLDEFYVRAGVPLPKIEPIPGNRIPEPHRKLLVHGHDVTPTLEAFQGSDIHIEVLHSERRGDFYYREVVLRLDRDERPVKFGANRVCLPMLPSKVRALILEEHLPLGHIFNLLSAPHRSFPKCFLRIAADEFISRAFGLQGRQELYGRQARILNPRGQPLSEIVEILPPAD